MEGVVLCVVYCVLNKISDSGGEFGVELKFNFIDDFCFEFVVDQIELLCKLFELCIKFVDLCNKLVGNEKFEDLLIDVLNNIEQFKKFGMGKEE